MSYITECLETFKAINIPGCLKGRMLRDAATLKLISRDLIAARKYMVPPPSKLNIKVTQASMQHLKLSHPVIAVEFACPEARSEGMKGIVIETVPSTKRIALVYDCTKEIGPVRMLKDRKYIPEDAKGIAVISLYHVQRPDIKEGMWIPAMGIGYIDENITSHSPEALLIDNTVMKGEIRAFPLFHDALDELFYRERVTAEQAHDVIVNDVAEETMMAVRVAMLLQAKNLKEVQIAEAPVKLNKKREKSGKAPFFDYFTIDLFFSETTLRRHRKRIDFVGLRQAFQKAELMSDLRTVEGHFKTRKTGIFWWSTHERMMKVRGKE